MITRLPVYDLITLLYQPLSNVNLSLCCPLQLQSILEDEMQREKELKVRHRVLAIEDTQANRYAQQPRNDQLNYNVPSHFARYPPGSRARAQQFAKIPQALDGPSEGNRGGLRLTQGLDDEGRVDGGARGKYDDEGRVDGGARGKYVSLYWGYCWRW